MCKQTWNKCDNVRYIGLGNNPVKNIKLLGVLIEEKALVRLLKTIGNKEYHTRELLKMLGGYGYDHKRLLKAHNTMD
jgi:hypothetical protein